MTPLESMVAHLMRFVDCGSRDYAVHAARRYALTDPWQLADLPAALDVAIGLRSATIRPAVSSPGQPEASASSSRSAPDAGRTTANTTWREPVASKRSAMRSAGASRASSGRSSRAS